VEYDRIRCLSTADPVAIDAMDLVVMCPTAHSFCLGLMG